MTDAPDRIRVFAEDWKPRKNFIVMGDTEYLRATPARLHAEELADMLRSVAAMVQHAIGQGRDVFIEPDTRRKLSDVTALLARIEGGKP